MTKVMGVGNLLVLVWGESPQTEDREGYEGVWAFGGRWHPAPCRRRLGEALPIGDGVGSRRVMACGTITQVSFGPQR